MLASLALMELFLLVDWELVYMIGPAVVTRKVRQERVFVFASSEQKELELVLIVTMMERLMLV